MKKANLIMVFFILLFPTARAFNFSLSDEGTNVENIATGALLTCGDLEIYIYNQSAGGALMFNQNYTCAINGGAWNVMLENVSLEYGREYWKDYVISGDNMAFGGANRIHFYSPLGAINETMFVHDLNLSNATGYNLGNIYGIGDLYDNVSYLQGDSVELFDSRDAMYINVSNLQTSNGSVWTTLGLVSQNFTSLGTSNTSLWTTLGQVGQNFTSLGTSNGSIWTVLGLVGINFTSFTTSNSSIWTTLGLIDRNFTSLGNSTLVRAGYSVCAAGYVMQNVSVNASGITANCTVDQTGGGSSSTVGFFNLTDLWDSEIYYRRTSFESVTTVYTQPWVPGVIASGTVALRAGEYQHPGIGRQSSSTSASSGHQFSITGATTYSLGENYTTQASFRPNAAKCYWNTTYGPFVLPKNNGTRIIFGFTDTYTVGTPVDGVYFNVTQLNETHFYARGMSRANGALATTATNWTFLNYTWQTYTVYINSTSLATFIISNGTTEYWRDTVATVPNGVGRETSNAIISYVNGSSFGGAQILNDIDHISVGINKRLLR